MSLNQISQVAQLVIQFCQNMGFRADLSYFFASVI
jgi:hypothetical protein